MVNKVSESIDIPHIILGTVHIMIGVFTAFYAFVIPKKFMFDFIYVAYTIVIYILWCIYDKCPITHYYHKYTNKIDYEAVISTDSKLYIIGDNLLDIVLLASIYIASTRSKIMSKQITLLYLFIKVFYNFLIKKNTLFIKIKQNGFLKNNRCFIIKIICLLNILIFGYIFYKNKNRLI